MVYRTKWRFDVIEGDHSSVYGVADFNSVAIFPQEPVFRGILELALFQISLGWKFFIWPQKDH